LVDAGRSRALDRCASLDRSWIVQETARTGSGVVLNSGRVLPADFWRLWGAATISSIGDGVRFAALPLLAAGLTRDPQSVSLVAAAAGLPWLVFGLPAGALVDRWDRKRVLWGVDFGRTAVVGLLAAAVASDLATVPLLTAAAFLLGSAHTLADSAAQAALPAMVPAAHLERANGRLYAGMLAAGGFAGPPLGGVLFGVAAPLPFGFDAVTFLAAALLALGLRADLAVPAAATTSGTGEPAGRFGIRAQIAEGVRWLWRHRELRAMCLLLTLWNLVENAILAVPVLWALEVLRLPKPAYGVLLTGLAAAGVLGSLLADPLGRTFGAGRGIAASLWATVLAYLGLGLTSHGVVGFALLGLVGAAAMVWNVLTASFRQAVVPGRLQGRVNSVYRGASWGVIPIGAALGGAAADHLGLRTPFLLGAALLAVAGTVGLPRLGTARLAQARAEATQA
jgi:MFS family permease